MPWRNIIISCDDKSAEHHVHKILHMTGWTHFVRTLRNTCLKPRPLAGVLLVPEHSLQDLLVPSWHKTHRTQQLQHCDLGLEVLSGQTLRDHVDPGRVGEDVCSTSL